MGSVCAGACVVCVSGVRVSVRVYVCVRTRARSITGPLVLVSLLLYFQVLHRRCP